MNIAAGPIQVESMNDRPNFLFFITDQQRADWLGCMGHPIVRTPNIDALAQAGSLFTDFHVASPVCMPNRAALMTGRMPSLNGVRYNGCPLPYSATTFVEVLAAAGYDTASIGKSHLQPFTGVPAFHGPGPKGRLIDEAWRSDDGDYGKELRSRYASDTDYSFPTPYYGFNHVDMVTDHGDKCGGHYEQWFRRERSDWQALHDPANELAHNYSCPQVYRTPVPEACYPTAWIGDRAVSYIEDRAQSTAPCFAFVSFPDPHHPFNPPGKYWSLYAPEDFVLPLPYEAHENPTPPMQFLTQRLRDGLDGETKQSAIRLANQHIREAMALTAGMISLIDDQVGRVMQTLRDTGKHENTVVIFSADHGDYLGDFGLMLKGPMPFRSVTRVPMIWSDPRDRTSRKSDILASTIDLPATILDRTGVTPYNGIQGASFLGCVFGARQHRDELLIEYNDGLARIGFSRPARVRSLLTKRHRFTCYKGEDWGELYDLSGDPNECRNLWDDTGFSREKAELSLRLIDHLAGQMDESPLSEWLA